MEASTKVRTETAIAARCEYQTPFGPGWLVWSGGELQEVRLPGQSRHHTPVARPPVEVAALAADLSRYFAGRGPAPILPELAERAATPFLRCVYRVVAAIPAGSTLTYAEVAREAGRPGAARAVGRAMATNPFPILVPCHRVVGSGGGLGGYGGGLDMKRALLEMERRGAQ